MPPFTPRLVNVPTDVMLGCAFAVTVVAVSAEAADTQINPPDPFVDNTCPETPPVILTLLFDPKLTFAPVKDAFPDTVRLVSVPVLVIFGWAAVVTVPAIVAAGTVPDTLAPATALAVVAKGTVPVTLAPAIALKPLPLPVNTPVFAVIFAAVMSPLTPNDVSVPTLVMFG